MAKHLILVLKLKKKNDVINVVKTMRLHWENAKWRVNKTVGFFESKLLYLNSSKSRNFLKWKCYLNLKKSIFFTIAWYKTYIENPKKIQNFSINQIKKFSELLNN